MKKLVTPLLIALASTLALAQSPAPEMADAEVREEDKEARKVTLKHGPLKSLDMPAMTMVFQVRDTTLLEKITAGDRIRFTAEQQQGAYVLTHVEQAAR